MNANRAVGEALPTPVTNTQAVMYPYLARGQTVLALTGDDANMVRMAQTGVDRLAGTPDDYRTYLRWVEDCAGADIRVDLAFQDSLALCTLARDRSFSQGPIAFHWSVNLPSGETALPITLQFDAPWDFGQEAMFLSGFESSDLSEWSAAVP